MGLPSPSTEENLLSGVRQLVDELDARYKAPDANKLDGLDSLEFLRLATPATRKLDFGHATGTSNGSGQISVSFAITFPSAPVVVAIPANASHSIIMRVQSVTTTGFLATFFTTAGAADASQSQDCFWIAVG